MARGWGKNEEDVGAEKEHDREARERAAARPSREYADRLVRRRSLELSLARIEELLAKTQNPDRRAALEAARAELSERLDGAALLAMKIATWNVNGIRAREAQVREWLAADRPDAVCLQEIKAKPEQIPELLFETEGYWCYWHGAGGYSGVALHLRKELCAARPTFGHPAFDYETRIVTADIGDLTIASVYVPNGGKDYAAKLRFLEGLSAAGRGRFARPGAGSSSPEI